jgi:hypothetical protein
MSYFCPNGEMAEWSNAAVLKTVVLLSRDRGFESLFLRKTQYYRALAWFFCFYQCRTKLASVKGW